jgi:uncharacterized protein (TIGR02421 family)
LKRSLGEDPRGFVDAVVARLAGDQPVRRVVPGGWLHIDRPLPFLCVHRSASDDTATGAERLVLSQASHLRVAEDGALAAPVRRLVVALAEQLGRRFGSFLVLELWTGPPDEPFRVHAPTEDRATTVDALAKALGGIDVLGVSARVEVVDDPAASPPGRAPLLSEEDQRRLGALVIGLEVPHFFVDETGRVLPLVSRRLQAELTEAVQRAVFEFASVQTSFGSEDFRALGQRRLLAAARRVDKALAEVAAAIDYLLAVTPTDTDVAWARFQEHGYRRSPEFHYRPLTVDPDLLRRQLYDVEIEAVGEPTLAAVFRSKRRELDRQIGLLEDRGSDDFLPTSLQLFGRVDAGLLTLAEAVLDRIARPGPARDGGGTPGHLDAHAFADLARAELAHYRETDGSLSTDVAVRDDVPGVLVSNGQLLVGARVRIPVVRADALIQHEVGTHVVTEANGRAQPLLLLRVGLPGYEETQEGLAVLAEFIAGGLTPSRLATVAARVVAVDRLVAGASFVDTFRDLHERHGLAAGRAFQVTARVYRAGGLTKDAIYLRGLHRVLAYLAGGGPIDPLLVGKLPLDDVAIVEELTWRGVLTPPRLRPRWLERPGADERLAAVRDGLDVAGLAEEVLR